MTLDLEAARRRLAAHDPLIGREPSSEPEPEPKRLTRTCGPVRAVVSEAELREAREDGGYAERLVWRYGPERAALILEGNDPATNEDIAKWKKLGRAK